MAAKKPNPFEKAAPAAPAKGKPGAKPAAAPAKGKPAPFPPKKGGK